MTVLQQVHRLSDGDGFLYLVEFDDPTTPNTRIRLVSDTQDWTIGGHLYTALPMQINMPQETENEPAAARLELMNDGSALIAVLEKIPPMAVVEVSLKIVSRAAPHDTLWGAYATDLRKASAADMVVSFSLGDDDLYRQQAVRLMHSPETSPGVFAG